MMFIEGKIEVSLRDFWDWLMTNNPELKWLEVRFGVPYVENNALIVSLAASDAIPPEEWETTPKAITEWERLRK